MATEMTKTLEGVGAFEIQEGSRHETLISDSVVSVAQTGEKGAENNHVDVGEDLADEKGVVAVQTCFQGPRDEIAVAGSCESKIEEDEEVTSLAVTETETNNELDVDLEMEEAGNGDEKLDIDLNGEEDEQENKAEIQSDGEQKEEYQIGDLVWGKIRSHPWWPGQIYDSSDASDYAKKQKLSGHLVAYFGDGSFSWCSRSQLRHMKGDDFDKKSRQSNSQDFSTAVEGALDEISRLVKHKMTCSCIPIVADRQFVENAGIKQGVLVPDHGITLLSTVGFESNELLSTIKSIAKISSAKNRLEVATITGWLSAFNRKTKCRHELAVFNDPCYINGLEDNKKKEVKKVVLPRLSIPVEIVSDEEALSLKKKGDDSSIDPFHQRKKKSVADLLKESKTVVETDDSQPPTTKTLKSAKRTKMGNESSRKSTKKKTNENEKDDKEKGDDENMEIVHTPRERKRSKYLSPPYTNPNMFFSKRDFKLDPIEVAKLSSMNEPLTSSSESVVKTNSPVTSDSFLMEAKDTAKDVLSVLKVTALDPLDLTKKNPLGISKGVLLSFRDAYYLNGSTYKEYHQNQRGRKKRNLDNSGASHRKKKLKPCSMEKEPPTLLMVTFPPGFSLPSKDKIIGMFSKFGLLNEAMTDVSYNSYCARISFVNSSDAEEAFKTCSKEKPFGDGAGGKIKYRLGFATEVGAEKPKGEEDAAGDKIKYRVGFETEVGAEKPKGKDAAGDKIKYRVGFETEVGAEKPKGEDGDKSRFVFIKKKLEKMTSMLEKCDGSMSGERKKKLEMEMKGLLEKVSEMIAES